MAQRIKWLGLSYTLPIEPSRTRVYVWRKLRELGAQYLRQGVALLPNQEDCRRNLDRLSQKINSMGGQSVLFEMNFLEEEQEKKILASFEKQGQEDYRDFKTHIQEFIDSVETLSETQKLRRLRSLEREYQRIRRQRQTLGQSMGQLESGLRQIWDSFSREAGQAAELIKKLIGFD